MNRLGSVILSIVTISALASAPERAVAQQNALSEQIVGAWRLVSAVVEKDGRKIEPLGPNPRGAVMFVGGYYSFNMVRGERPRFASNDRQTGTPEENKAAVQGHISLVGKYTLTPDGSIKLEIIGSNFPNMEGTTREGKVEIKGDELRYTTRAAYIVPGGAALNILSAPSSPTDCAQSRPLAGESFIFRGPIRSADGADNIGTALLLELPDRAAADAFWNNEPFARNGGYQRDARIVRWVFGD